jgi:hypothetical protein
VARMATRAWARLRAEPQLVALAACIVLLALVHVWWLVRFRQGFPLDIDESGYLSSAFGSLGALKTGGVHNFWQSVQHQGQNAPLLPMTTAVVDLAIGGMRVIPSMLVQLPFYAVLLLASYGIGRRAGGPWSGLLMAVVVGTVPWITDFARTYHLVIPSTAMYTAATYALLASDGLLLRRFAIVFGVAAGLALLARTMLIAFVPALVVAAVVVALVAAGERRARLTNLALALAALGLTAATWYATSLRPALDYLRSHGYGTGSAPYGPSESPLSIDYWTHELGLAVNRALYLPLAIVLGAAFLLAAVARLRERRAPGRPSLPALRAWVAGDAFVLLVVVAEGYLALTSSRNDGTGFVVPLLPPLIGLALLARARLPWPRARTALAAAFVAVALFNVLMKADVLSAPSEQRALDVPLLGSLQVADGAGYLQQHLRATRAVTLGPPTQPLPKDYGNWQAVYIQVIDTVASAARKEDPAPVSVNVSSNEPLLNGSTLSVAAQRAGHPEAQLLISHTDTNGADSVGAYESYLASTRPRYLVTTTGKPRQFGAPITQDFVMQAARTVGFGRLAALPAPGGRVLRVWACCDPKLLGRARRRLKLDPPA